MPPWSGAGELSPLLIRISRAGCFGGPLTAGFALLPAAPRGQGVAPGTFQSRLGPPREGRKAVCYQQPEKSASPTLRKDRLLKPPKCAHFSP